jgi:hypothetical protein
MKAEFQYLKAGGAYSNHWALTGLKPAEQKLYPKDTFPAQK